ncbi:hypothetical protein WM40_10760 [Robbsia andropogonis]|uniref:Ethyl tert-butyl ether degradation protein EthD n=1 Tax=Robbsia andropogonis TaxID=28092 RepID=A0A0F5K1R5_9BURK|nr:EthD family reductase [Robbsia andropogonis]KKB63502.1 hypothetical protein WM40_10760 [Robbsia andropogonis]MCP1116871.1 EthD family reductase [Robbsia andropogonis]MCP1126450.1 EthD family reductase [Robbsia andropogonis]
MQCCLFLEARPSTDSNGATTVMDATALHRAVSEISGGVPGLLKLIVHTPVQGGANDPYLHNEIPPACTLQWYFDDLDRLEAACRDGGPIATILKRAGTFGLDGHAWVQQTMAVRRYGVPEPATGNTAPGAPAQCTYMVSYEGPADDMNAWLRHYIDSHPPIMARFPGIREIEIYSRMDSCNTLDVAFVTPMQRNKVVFDSPAALDAALASPVRHQMRADFKEFPPYQGANHHFPMHSVGRVYSA